MKIIYSLALAFFMSAHAVAQIEDNPNRLNRGNNFNTSDSRSLRNRQNSLSTGKRDLLRKKEDKKSSYLQEEEKKFDMQDEKVFVTKEADFKPEYSGNGRERKVKDEYDNDKSYGEFTNNGQYVRIVCRDHQAVDGDLVRVLINGKVYINKIFLDSKAKGFRLNLEKGFNKIEFEALNQGSSGPNTAAFQVYDDKGNTLLSNEWNLTTGTKASLIVIKNKDAEEESSND